MLTQKRSGGGGCTYLSNVYCNISESCSVGETHHFTIAKKLQNIDLKWRYF
jgi:hypothetical protein